MCILVPNYRLSIENWKYYFHRTPCKYDRIMSSKTILGGYVREYSYCSRLGILILIDGSEWSSISVGLLFFARLQENNRLESFFYGYRCTVSIFSLRLIFSGSVFANLLLQFMFFFHPSPFFQAPFNQTSWAEKLDWPNDGYVSARQNCWFGKL